MQIVDLIVDPDHMGDAQMIRSLALARAGLRDDGQLRVRVTRRSIDARSKMPRFLLRVAVGGGSGADVLPAQASWGEEGGCGRGRTGRILRGPDPAGGGGQAGGSGAWPGRARPAQRREEDLLPGAHSSPLQLLFRGGRGRDIFRWQALYPVHKARERGSHSGSFRGTRCIPGHWRGRPSPPGFQCPAPPGALHARVRRRRRRGDSFRRPCRGSCGGCRSVARGAPGQWPAGGRGRRHPGHRAFGPGYLRPAAPAGDSAGSQTLCPGCAHRTPADPGGQDVLPPFSPASLPARSQLPHRMPDRGKGCFLLLHVPGGLWFPLPRLRENWF